jgi:threonylcarbamoyladenosine tRNA methylthiotransferase MtaB
MQPAKRAIIYTLGCRLNHAESSLIAERLIQAGYKIAEDGETADVCIINTCTVTGEADAKSRKTIRSFIRKHPEAFVAVVGCYAELASDLIEEIPGVDLVLGSRNKLDVVELLGDRKNAGPLVQRKRFDSEDFAIPVCETADAPLALGHRANLKIQDGCDQWCSYCIVPAARGPARSRVFDNLVDDARALARRGAKEIVLTGVNVGAYASRDKRLVDVIDAIDALDGVRRIRIGSIELPAINNALLERMADADHALTPFLHVPLQSGSDRIIKMMKRRYDAETFRAFTFSAAKKVPGICLGVDALVGFPGETEEDFAATLNLIAETPVAYAHVFKYSDRKGAASVSLPEKIDAKTLDDRGERVRKLSLEKRREFHEQAIGRKIDVLFEEKDQSRWWGYTGNYIRVATFSDENLENTLREVIASSDCGEFVQGELI